MVLLVGQSGKLALRVNTEGCRVTKTLVVLAAGMGSRYGGMKQVDPLGPSGEFIIDYSVYDAIRAGFSRVVFVIRRDIDEEFRHTIGQRIGAHVTVGYAYQELADIPTGFAVPEDRAKPWGTGHAVLAAREVVDGPFAVINSDDFYGRESYEVLSRFLSETEADPRRYAMVGFPLRVTLSDHGAVSRGIGELAEDGTLKRLTEMTHIERTTDGARTPDGALTGDEPASLNLWAFKSSFFAPLEDRFKSFLEASIDDPKAEFFLPAVVSNLVEEDEVAVQVLSSNGPWFGMTHRADRPRVVASIEDLIAKGIYAPDLWAQ